MKDWQYKWLKFCDVMSLQGWGYRPTKIYSKEDHAMNEDSLIYQVHKTKAKKEPAAGVVEEANAAAIRDAEAEGIIDVVGEKELTPTERYRGWRLRGGEGRPPWWKAITS